MNKIDRLSSENFKQIVESSRSISEVLRKCNATHGRYFNYFHLRVGRENINIDHFDGRSNDKSPIKFNDEMLFIKGSRSNNSNIKRRYLQKVTDYKCAICQISKWNEQELTLQLDHIDGDNSNNILDNLRLLCPNCHSQTLTFCRGNVDKIVYTYQHTPVETFCLCGNKKYNEKTKRCRRCDDLNRPEKVKWPEREELQNMLSMYSFSAMSRILNISDNGIRKKCRKLGLI